MTTQRLSTECFNNFKTERSSDVLTADLQCAFSFMQYSVFPDMLRMGYLNKVIFPVENAIIPDHK